MNRTLIAAAVTLLTSTLAHAREFGVDVSHWQGEGGIPQSRWDTIAASGRSFAYIKATEGLTGPHDTAMANNLLRASAAGILTGVYHYCHPENRPTTAGAVLEADQFMAYAGSAIGPGHLRPVLDLEGSALRLSTYDLTSWVLAFVDRIVEVKGPAAEPIIYANRSTAAFELDARISERDLDLWLAYWPTGLDFNIADPPPTAQYPDPTGHFNNWVIWQYTGTGSLAGISPIDLDVVHSEYMPLSALVIPEPAAGLLLACPALLATRNPRSKRRRAFLIA